MTPLLQRNGMRQIWALFASLLLVCCFFVKGALFETFSDVQAYSQYALYFFEERELALFLWFGATLLPAAILMARYLERNVKGVQLSQLLFGQEVSDRHFSLVFSGFVAVIAFSQAYVTLGLSPITDDERVYRFMAELLASGRLRYPQPPQELWPFLNLAFMNLDGHWTGIYFWGHPLWLAPGVILGCPQIMNALSAGITAYCTFHLSRELFDSSVARLSAMLLLISPLFIFGSATLFSQCSATMFISAGALCYVKLHKTDGRGWHWAFLSGAMLCWSFYCRPASAAFIGFITLHIFLSLISSRAAFIKKMWPFFFGALVIFLIFSSIQSQLGFQFYYTPKDYGHLHHPGLGLNDYVFPYYRFTSLLAASNTLDNLVKLNLWAFGWPISLLLPVCLLVFRRPGILELSLWGALLTHVLMMAFYWSTGVDDIGPAYHFVLVPVVAILTAQGILDGSRSLHASFPKVFSRTLSSFVLSLCLLCTPIAWILHVASLDAITSRIQAPLKLVHDAKIERNALVFFEEPLQHMSWVFHFPISTPPFDQPIVFLRDHGASSNKHISKKYFPKRIAYRLTCNNRRKWAVERLSDGKVILHGPPIWGDRFFYPPRKPYPYRAFWDHPRQNHPSEKK